MPVATNFSPYFKIANKEHFKEEFDACLSTVLKAVGFGETLEQNWWFTFQQKGFLLPWMLPDAVRLR